MPVLLIVLILVASTWWRILGLVVKRVVVAAAAASAGRRNDPWLVNFVTSIREEVSGGHGQNQGPDGGRRTAISGKPPPGC